MRSSPHGLHIEPSADLREALALKVLTQQMDHIQPFADRWDTVIVMAKSHPELPKESLDDAVLVMESQMAQAGIKVSPYYENHDDQHWVGFKIRGKLLSRARRVLNSQSTPRMATGLH